MARKLSVDNIKYIKELQDLLDLYEPVHDYYYKKLGRVARKFNKDVPYSYGSFQGYRSRIEGAIVRAQTTGMMSNTLKDAHKQLRTLTTPQRGVVGASPKTVLRELAVEHMKDWKEAVFGADLSQADIDFRQVLTDEGLWDNDKFWLEFFRSNYFHPIYQDYRDKQVSAELFKRLISGQPSYWVERLMDFYASHVKGDTDFRYKGQKMLAENKLGEYDSEDDEGDDDEE